LTSVLGLEGEDARLEVFQAPGDGGREHLALDDAEPDLGAWWRPMGIGGGLCSTNRPSGRGYPWRVTFISAAYLGVSVPNVRCRFTGLRHHPAMPRTPGPIEKPHDRQRDRTEVARIQGRRVPTKPRAVHSWRERSTSGWRPAVRPSPAPPILDSGARAAVRSQSRWPGGHSPPGCA
jgi:hypothetical protein